MTHCGGNWEGMGEEKEGKQRGREGSREGNDEGERGEMGLPGEKRREEGDRHGEKG